MAALGVSRLYALEEALAESGLVLLLVDHDEFLNPDPQALAGKTIIDTRGIWAQTKPEDAARGLAVAGAAAGD